MLVGQEEEYFKSYLQFKIQNPQTSKLHTAILRNATTSHGKECEMRRFFIENKLLIDIETPRYPKDNMEARHFYMLGNQKFETNQYEDALLNYNQALCYGEAGSEIVGLTYGNKSGVYFEMEQYDHCLKAIQLAQQNKFPNHLNQELVKREKACLTQLLATPNTFKSKEMPLSYESLPNISFLANCMELKKCQKYGRGMYATKDLKIGDVVSIEKSVAHLSRHPYIRCCYCMKENRMNLIPCDTCTSAMFCSKSCQEKANEEFHQYECSIIDGVFEIDIETSFLNLRMLWLAFKAFENTQKFMAYIKKVNVQKINTMHLDFKNRSPKDLYKSVLALQTSHDNSDFKIFRVAFLSAALSNLILKDPGLTQRFKTVEEKEFLFKILCMHANAIYVNAYGAFEPKPVTDMDNFVTEAGHICVGAGIYSIASFFNHSCAPNLARAHQRNIFNVYVQKPVQKGEQLFISYGHSNTEVNRQLLKDKYGIMCDCLACKNHPSDADYQVPPHLTEVFSLLGGMEHKDEENVKRICQALSSKAFEHHPIQAKALEYILNVHMDYECREYE